MTRSTTTGLSRACALAGRILVFLSVLLVAVTPFTENFWNFDNFLRGGQDFEFNFLAFLVVLCLVLLLAQHAYQRCSLVLTLRRRLRFLFPNSSPAALIAFSGAAQIVDDPPVPSPSLGFYTLPLQI